MLLNCKKFSRGLDMNYSLIMRRAYAIRSQWLLIQPLLERFVQLIKLADTTNVVVAVVLGSVNWFSIGQIHIPNIFCIGFSLG